MSALLTNLPPVGRAQALHHRLVEAWALRRRSEHDAAVLLASIADENAYLELGHSTIGGYAGAVLDLPARQARDLLRIGRALPALPALKRAFAEGRLSWSKVRELVRVVEPETEVAWVERAAAIPGHELERLVASAERGEPPPAQPGRRPERSRLVFETATSDADAIREAIAWFRASAGLDDAVDDGALLAMMLKRRVHDAREEDVAQGRTPPSTEPYRIVIEHCPICGSAHGGDIEITDTVALEAACDNEVVDMRPGEDQWSLSHTIPPKVRRTVLIRDGHRCRIPGCRNRNWVHLHHVKSRVYDGKSVPQNLVTLCDGHHRILHAGFLGMEVAKGEIVIRLRDGTVHTVPLDPRGSLSRPAGQADFPGDGPHAHDLG